MAHDQPRVTVTLNGKNENISSIIWNKTRVSTNLLSDIVPKLLDRIVIYEGYRKRIKIENKEANLLLFKD